MRNVTPFGAGGWLHPAGGRGVSRRLAAVIAALLAIEAALPFALHTSFRRVALLAGPLLALAPLAYFPWLSLPALLSYAPFAPALRFAGASTLQSLSKDVFALLLVAVWSLRVLVERRRWVRTPLDVWLVLFMALLALQVLRAPSLMRGVVGLKVLILYVPIYFLVTNNAPTRSQLRRVLWLVVLVAAVTALYGLWQYVTLHDQKNIAITIEGQQSFVSLRNGSFRVFSTFTHSVVFSLYLSLMLVLAAALALAESGWRRWLAIGIAGLLIGVLPLTLSRIGWIGAAIGLLVIGILTMKRSRIQIIALIALAVILFIGFATPAARDTLSWSFTSEDRSYVERTSIYYWGHRMVFVEMPLGCGVGSMKDAADLLARLTKQPEPPYTCYWNGFPVTSSETMALAIGTQTGAAGYLLYAILHIVIWREGLRSYRRLADGPFKIMAAGLLGYLAIMTFSNFVSSSTQAYPVVDLYFWAFVGLIMSLDRIAASTKLARPTPHST